MSLTISQLNKIKTKFTHSLLRDQIVEFHPKLSRDTIHAFISEDIAIRRRELLSFGLDLNIVITVSLLMDIIDDSTFHRNITSSWCTRTKSLKHVTEKDKCITISRTQIDLLSNYLGFKYKSVVEYLIYITAIRGNRNIDIKALNFLYTNATKINCREIKDLVDNAFYITLDKENFSMKKLSSGIYSI